MNKEANSPLCSTCREAEVEAISPGPGTPLTGEAVADALLSQRGGVGGCPPFSLGLFRLLNSTCGDPSPTSHSEQVLTANDQGFFFLERMRPRGSERHCDSG